MFDSFLACSIFAVSLFFTGQLRNFARKKNILDIPNTRSSHHTPTPRGGGLAIISAFLLSVCFYSLNSKLSLSEFFAFAVGGSLVAGIGMMDDIADVSAGLRFLFHCLAVVLGLFWLGGVPPTAISFISSPPILVINFMAALFLVWLLNLFNFMDGIDGLAAVEASSVALGAALILSTKTEASRDVWLLIFFAFSCLGFLYWNWPPARIFMGDVGSGFLGYTIGILMVLTVRSGTMTLPAWIILLGAFLVDATVTLTSRILAGEQWYAAHCSHAYQCAARRFKSHKKVTLVVLIINIFWLLPMAWVAEVRPSLSWIIVLISMVPLIILVIHQRASSLN